MYCLVTLCLLLDGIMASSNANTGGTLKPRANVCCKVSTTERTFQARSVAACESVLSVKCKFCIKRPNRAFDIKRPNAPFGTAPTAVVAQWSANRRFWGHNIRATSNPMQCNSSSG
ncbi:hypothetical protein PF008_g7881 [Phytophthora fragariae]|uniref:Secreted protein n=1 Tax=Phytophthora fragariae TaxID=53985 RepID=A0A6G0S1T9_9STRA|nr:hypothetical protein PF008_g7881 [Phytophthora fragariae]